MTITDVVLVLGGAMAGGLGWGLRGQIGHEIGAMAPGALVGLVLALAARHAGFVGPEPLLIVGVTACALSLGGNMTYGQTLGLCQGPRENRRYWWGLLGCWVKGSAWWGLAAMLVLAVTTDLPSTSRFAVLGAMMVGGGLAYLAVNQPFDPPRAYPRVYFSEVSDEPGNPRHETWGAFWGALLAGAVAYAVLVRAGLGSLASPVVACAAVFVAAGVLGGGLGFALGEAAQAWGSDTAPLGSRVQPWMDWWKVMEVGFGLIAGGALVAGWIVGLGWLRGAAGGASAADMLVGSRPWAWLPIPAGRGECVAQTLLALAVGLPYILWQVNWRAAEAVVDVPLACGMAMTAVAALGVWPGSVVGLAVPTIAWWLDVARKWGPDAGIVSPSVAWSVATLKGLGAAAVGQALVWFVLAGSTPLAGLRPWMIGAYYGAVWLAQCWVKELARPGLRASVAQMGLLRGLGGTMRRGVVVQGVLTVMYLLMTVLLWAGGR